MIRLLIFHALVYLCIILYAADVALANEATYSTTQTGMIGLNTVPSARMDDVGTIRGGFSRSSPYNHAFIGLQIAKPLYINLRQSMLVSSIFNEPKNVYPGMDIKLRLAKESRYKPEIALGIDSILGHKKFSSEYITLSKRYYDFDFTGGLAWGRLAGDGHINNPLSPFSSHFDDDRDFNDEDRSSLNDLFSGDNIGFFGGVEYFTPIDGLSLKADFSSPNPWSFGFNYSPKDWISLGAAVIGSDTIMARLSLQGNLFDWGNTSYKKTTDDMQPRIKPEDITIEGSKIIGELHLNDYEPSTIQIGRAAKELAKQSKPDIKTIVIIPMMNGTKSRSMSFVRKDLQKDKLNHQKSPEEIWHNVEFTTQNKIDFSKSFPRTYKLAPELSFSLGEEETTSLYRVSIVGEEQKNLGYGFVAGNSFRLNIADDYKKLSNFRDMNLNSIRSDIDYFTQNRINVNKSFLSFLVTPLPDFHFAATAGYLEEMFAGYGAEILYRPHQSAFAIGMEGWQLYKRDPTSSLALGIYGENRTSALLNLYYAIPDTNITAFAKTGRFIGGDLGFSAGAMMQLSNGMNIKGSFSISDSNDKDVFDSERNIQAGIQLSLPLGDLKFIPQGSEVRLNTHQVGRDDAAMVDKPVDLYEVTEPTSYRHLGQNWQEVLN